MLKVYHIFGFVSFEIIALPTYKLTIINFIYIIIFAIIIINNIFIIDHIKHWSSYQYIYMYIMTIVIILLMLDDIVDRAIPMIM